MQQQAQTTAIGPAADLNDIASQASYIAAQFEEQQEKRDRMEAEQEALRRKREEREARRLARQFELAEAQGALPELPDDPPPPLQQRGRQMSNLI